MSLTNVKRGHNRRVYVSRGSEQAEVGGSYGAGGTTLDMVLNCRNGEGAYLQLQPLTALGTTATGHEQPTQQLHMGKDTPEITLPLLAAAESLGWALGFLGGSDTISGTTNITHSIVPIALTTGFPGSCEIEDHRAGANAGPTDARFKGMYVKQVVISGGRTGHVNVDVTVRGNGSFANAGNQTESSMAKPGRDSGYFPAQSATLGLRALTSEHDPEAQAYVTPTAAFTAKNVVAPDWDPATGEVFTDELDSWTLTLTDVYVEETTRSTGQGSSAGLVGSCPALHHREASLSLTFIDEPTFDEYLASAVLAGSDTNNFERSFALELVNDYDLNTTDYAGVLIHVPVMFMPQAANGSYGDRNTLTMELVSGQSMGADAYPVWRAFVHDGYNGVYCQA